MLVIMNTWVKLLTIQAVSYSFSLIDIYLPVALLLLCSYPINHARQNTNHQAYKKKLEISNDYEEKH